MYKKILMTARILLYELFPGLVLEKAKYRLEGECCKCGDCCRYIICAEPFSKEDFELTRFFFPKYRRFKIIGTDSEGNNILACSLIGEDGLCPDYERRPQLCSAYPNPKKIYSGGKLYKRCTYRLLPKKPSASYL